MDTTELSKIDLNLLISLDILMQEQSVSRAAKRLHITQNVPVLRHGRRGNGLHP